MIPTFQNISAKLNMCVTNELYPTLLNVKISLSSLPPYDTDSKFCKTLSAVTAGKQPQVGAE
jgi:hypothetical protein